MKNTPEIIIRKATLEDIPAIYQLVVELAIYEKEPKAVSATLEDFEFNFQKGLFGAHVALDDDKVVGMTLYYLTFSTWKGRMLYLEDFVITASHRKKGIGQALYDAFLQEARDQKAVLVKWQVLDWNQPAIQFYEKNKGIFEKDWWNVKQFLS